MAATSIGIISAYLIPVILFILLIVFLIFAIIVLTKVSKALSIWIRKNDDGNPQPPVQQDSNENSI